jgi:exonuclease SbcC
MRPLRIELEGFLSYRDRVEVDLSDLGAAAILGPNGSGKTTLVEAIGWALWGEGRGRGPDDYVNPESTRAEVVVVLDLSGRKYRVTRERIAGKSARSALTLAVWDVLGIHGLADGEEPTDVIAEQIEEGWRDLGHPNIVDTERAIRELVGMTFETWRSTSFVGQGDADAFTRRRPAERKALLAEVLELERFGRLAELARTAVGEARGHLEGLEGDLQVARARAETRTDLEAEIATARSRWTDREAEVERRQIAAEEAAAGLQRAEAAVSRVREAESRVAAVRGRLAGLRAEMDALTLEAGRLEEIMAAGPAAGAAAEQARADLEAATERVSATTADLAEVQELEATTAERGRGLDVRLAEATERRERLEGLGNVCPTCEQGIDAGVAARLYRGAQAEERKLAGDLATAAQELAIYRRDCARIGNDLQEARANLTRTMERADAARRQIEDAQRAGAELVRVRDRFESLRPTLAELEAEMASIEELDLQAEQARHRSAAEAATAARDRLASATRDLTRTASIVGSLNAQMDEVERAEADLDRYEDERVEFAAMLRVAEIAARAFGRDGIPALLIETAIPELEAGANELLELLTGGRLTVGLETLAAKKTGGMRETLEIVVGDDVSERPLEALSGGERQMVDLSLRIALSRLLVRRKGRRIETLIVDEGFTALDVAHRQRTIEAFAKLATVFPTVIVVTHLADLAEAFPTRLLVERAGGTSTVRREG